MEEMQAEASEGCPGHTLMVSNNQKEEVEIDEMKTETDEMKT